MTNGILDTITDRAACALLPKWACWLKQNSKWILLAVAGLGLFWLSAKLF